MFQDFDRASGLVDERAAMARALELAWRGWGRAWPNPLVGAVVLRDGAIVGEGWHAEYGGPHAEPVALAAAGDRARGATLVVTLEPCVHQGKTPPCAEAVANAGVSRVVIALADPNPIASGGADRLRAAGVDVSIGLLGDEAAAQNAAFLRLIGDESRPFVALKLATSIDFKIADRQGRSRWISGEAAREFVHWLRAGFDAIAVGLGTARADDPALTARGTPAPRLPLRRIVFDRDLDLPFGLRLVTDNPASTTVIGGPAADAAREQALVTHGVRVLRAAGPASALARLRDDGVGSLLVEGGGRLAGALLRDGLVDRFYWIQSPIWLGDAGVPAVRGLESSEVNRAERWRIVERRALGPDALLVLDRR
ncbi:MAG TPA: bifunctional diaminohydroxyphosphoribosylaminopyrimidine deaminase/5-amino-6-(5-phosphoribosylamino)uracil reductase RibD [Gemmatimonadales bacterium]|nr:bifunctional diaminohydroxyphosphoribosylaminopyrimidine deaminase/5-amino-6-(5-phosphoribosylamino)uracil reductase RibD [Gemmatimonadales bacterium]